MHQSHTLGQDQLRDSTRLQKNPTGMWYKQSNFLQNKAQLSQYCCHMHVKIDRAIALQKCSDLSKFHLTHIASPFDPKGIQQNCQEQDKKQQKQQIKIHKRVLKNQTKRILQPNRFIWRHKAVISPPKKKKKHTHTHIQEKNLPYFVFMTVIYALG